MKEERDFFRTDFETRYLGVRQLKRLITIIGLKRVIGLHAFIEESLAAKRDPVMGIARRGEWFQILTSEACRLYPELKRWNTLGTEELATAIDRFSPEKSIWTAFGDIAYLSLVNHYLGHYGGDGFLGAIGKALQATEKAPHDLPGRLGGDEVAILFLERSFKFVTLTCQQVENSIAAIPLEIGGMQLPSHIDLGVASFKEALGVFQKHVANLAQKKESYPQGQRLSDLVDTLVRLADRRSDVAKVYGRVRLLVDLFLNDVLTFDKCFAFLSKGGGNISREEVYELARIKINDPEAFEQAVVARALAPKETRSFFEAEIEAAALAPLRQAFGIT